MLFSDSIIIYKFLYARYIYIMPTKSISLQLLGGGGGASGGSGMDGGATREHTRFTLRNAWNGAAASGKINGHKIAATPFRAVNNAGDLLNRVNYTSGGSNQVKTGRIRIAANQSANILGGSIFAKPDSTGVPSATTNVKFVYDGSDYTKFKKQQAVNRNYNDPSFGGAHHKAASKQKAPVSVLPDSPFF
jgi:hypothetical protein